MMAQRRSMDREGNWRSLISKQEASGMSVSAFCRQHEVPESSFYSWKRKLKQRRREDELSHESKSQERPRRDMPRNNTAATFVPLELHAPPAVARANGEVVLSDGCRIIVSSQCDPGWLREIIQVVQERAC